MSTAKSYEKAMARLEEILQKLGDESTVLGDSLKLYAEAAELIRFCTETLNDAELKVQTITEAMGRMQQGEE